MRRSLVLFLAPLPLMSHMVSMSSSELRIRGSQASFELRLPLYEVVHIPSAERSVFENIHFSTTGGPAKASGQRCREEPSDASLLCTAQYEFPGPVDRLDAEVTLFAITVPNHIHVMRATNGDKSDQAVFDASFTRTTVAFLPPTTFETLVTEFGSGLARAAGWAQLLFLAALVLAARSRRELVTLTGAFVAAEVAVAALMPMFSWEPAPRFIEAASALTIAYLAVEILLLPAAGKRWLVVAALGLFHGFYFAIFLRTSGYHTAFFLPGVIVAEVAVVAILGLVFGWLQRYATVLRPLRVSAAALLVVGLVWFAVRLRS